MHVAVDRLSGGLLGVLKGYESTYPMPPLEFTVVLLGLDSHNEIFAVCMVHGGAALLIKNMSGS